MMPLESSKTCKACISRLIAVAVSSHGMKLDTQMYPKYVIDGYGYGEKYVNVKYVSKYVEILSSDLVRITTSLWWR